MVVANADLELLLADDVLLGPVRVVFFGDLARLDDPLELLHHERADPHCLSSHRQHEGAVQRSGCPIRVEKAGDALSLRIRLSFL